MATAIAAASDPIMIGPRRIDMMAPALGSTSHVVPSICPIVGRHGSLSALLSPLVVKPASSEPPMILWMTLSPPPTSPAGIVYATMSPVWYAGLRRTITRSPA
jgi:hypothetical protein